MTRDRNQAGRRRNHDADHQWSVFALPAAAQTDDFDVGWPIDDTEAGGRL
jgi:hypothetical protein